MKLYVVVEFNKPKVYTFPAGRDEWTKREIVASFDNTPAGEIAFAAFKRGLVNTNHSLFDYLTNTCIVGDVGQLDAVR